MANPDTVPVEETDGGSEIVRELLVEVFLARGAAHHGDLGEAVAELRELFRQFAILTPENEALLRDKVTHLERRARRSRLRLVEHEPRPTPDDDR